jgi:hypothetical protein
MLSDDVMRRIAYVTDAAQRSVRLTHYQHPDLIRALCPIRIECAVIRGPSVEGREYSCAAIMTDFKVCVYAHLLPSGHDIASDCFVEEWSFGQRIATHDYALIFRMSEAGCNSVTYIYAQPPETLDD